MRLLVMGYGNPGRLDDGLGPALAQALEGMGLDGVDVDSNYQLNIEDAEKLVHYDAAVFVDAAVSGPEPFSFLPLKPGPPVTFTSHSLPAESVLSLARELFGAKTRCWALGIRGYKFNQFGERLSPEAQKNLRAALAYLLGWIQARPGGLGPS